MPVRLLLLFWLCASAIAADFEPNIPLLHLESARSLGYGQKLKASLQMEFPKASGLSNTEKLPCEMKYRGAVSMSYEKKSYAIKLDEAAPLAGMKARRDWVLNAAFIDRSLMRHKLSYDLFSSLSTEAAPRYAAGSRFVEVFINGRYEGVYLLTERVDRKLLHLKKYDKDDSAHACIYKAVDHSARFNQNGHHGYEQHEPDRDKHKYWQPLDELNRFCTTSRDTAFFDPATGISSRIEPGSAIDFHLLLLMVANNDGPDKNFILARDAARQENHPLFFFAPWDFDATFGRDWNASRLGPTMWLSNYLFDRLLENRDYRKRFVSRWRELRRAQFSIAGMHQMIDRNVETLGPAAQRNAKKWRRENGHFPDSLSFDEDIKQIKEWVVARVIWLDRAITDLENH